MSRVLAVQAKNTKIAAVKMDKEKRGRLNKQLNFLIEIDKLKTIERRNLIADGSRRENDAEHSWHFAMMALIFYEYAYSPEVNLDRVIKMGLVHDLVEIYAGDTFCYDEAGALDKADRENEAADKLFSILPADQAKEYRSLWEEFDAMETPDAIYAAAIDRFQPFLNNSATNWHTWSLTDVTKSKVYKRMEMVKCGMPQLWSFVEEMIAQALKDGRLKED